MLGREQIKFDVSEVFGGEMAPDPSLEQLIECIAYVLDLNKTLKSFWFPGVYPTPAQSVIERNG